MIPTSFVIYLIYIIPFVFSHDDDLGGPNLFFIYTEGLNIEKLSHIKNKVNISINIGPKDNRESILWSMVTGCVANITEPNCSDPCAPIWIPLKKKKLMTALIGLPKSLVFSFPFASIIIDESIFNMPLSVIMKRMTKSLKDKEISLIFMCIHGNINTDVFSLINKLFSESKVNVILVNAPSLKNSDHSVIVAGPAFVASLESHSKLKPIEIYPLILGVLRVKNVHLCVEENPAIAAILIPQHRDRDYSTLIIIVGIIAFSLVLSFVIVTMSIKGVFARKQKSNRFNLGARIDPKNLQQPERNYLLDSSDDDELFCDPTRDSRHPTVLRIHDNLSEITLQ